MTEPTPGGGFLRIHLKTTGCKVNQADALAVQSALADLPVRWVGADEPADLVVVNACAVTGAAERDGRAAVNRATRTGVPVVLAGCMATRIETAADRTGVPESAQVVGGTRDRGRLIQELRRAVLEAVDSRRLTVDGGQPGNGVGYGHGDGYGDGVGHESTDVDEPGHGRARPLLKVQDGCDCRCSYCIVPHLRGPSRSTPLDEVLAAFGALPLAAEVVLAGVDLGAWGRDLAGQPALADLLGAIAGLGTGTRLRLSSVEPHGLTGALLDRIAGPDGCPHLHVPLQSGSDRVLRAMNRPYDAAMLAGRVREAARRVPGLALGFDVIVGFPGETDDDFEATRALVETLPTTYLHVFPFSPRPGTPAADRPDDVPPPVKAARSAALRDLSLRRKVERSASHVGNVVEVVDIRARAGFVESLAADYTRVRRPGEAPRPGRFPVRVTAVDGATCMGVLA